MKHKRNKRSRLRGRKTCGWGSRKKHRGSGHRGGFGMAGTGKRADQKKTLIITQKPSYFGKHGFKSLQNVKCKKPIPINLFDIERKMNSFLERGIAKKTGEGIEVNLEGYKILGEGELKNKMVIIADSASNQALEKIKKAGCVIKIEKD